jgi:hypothetical protein
MPKKKLASPITYNGSHRCLYFDSETGLQCRFIQRDGDDYCQTHITEVLSYVDVKPKPISLSQAVSLPEVKHRGAGRPKKGEGKHPIKVVLKAKTKVGIEEAHKRRKEAAALLGIHNLQDLAQYLQECILEATKSGDIKTRLILIQTLASVLKSGGENMSVHLTFRPVDISNVELPDPVFPQDRETIK